MVEQALIMSGERTCVDRVTRVCRSARVHQSSGTKEVVVKKTFPLYKVEKVFFEQEGTAMKKLVLLLALALSLCACGTLAPSQTQVETPAETPPANTQPTDPLEGLTLRQKVGQLFVVRPDSLDFTQTQEQINDAKAEGVTAVTRELLAALEQYPVGGIAVFGKNIQSPDQLRID